jgi:hypothetical protein
VRARVWRLRLVRLGRLILALSFVVVLPVG